MAVDINDTPNRVRYTATAAQTAFSVPFQFLAAADLKLYQNGVLKTLSTHYTVTGAGASSGTVTLVSGAAASDDILIIRDMPVQRIGDFPVSGPFDVASLNDQLDAQIMMVRDIETRIDRRLLRQPVADLPETLSDIPAKAARANLYLGFDANGQPKADLPNAAVITDYGARIGNLETISGGLSAVGAVADNIASVTAVAAIDDKVVIAADNVADINNFADVYQGGKASNPTLRNDGTALQTGDLYFNTTNDRMRVYETGTGWIDYEATAQAAATTATTQAGTATSAASTATTQAGIATTQAGLAATARTGAETARDAAFVNAAVYASTAAGLAATTNGQQFMVPVGTTITRYRNDTGVATPIAYYPAESALDPLQRTNSAIFAVEDVDGNLGVDIQSPLRIDETGSIETESLLEGAEPWKWQWAISDLDGNIPVGVDHLGRLVADFSLAPLGQAVFKTNGTYDYTVNHVFCYGQSLSVGQATPVQSSIAAYDHLMFTRGMRPQYDYTGETAAQWYAGLVPAVEALSPANAALAETPSRGTGDAIKELIESEDGKVYTDHEYKLLLSAPGYGATTISELSKGSTHFTRMVTQTTYGLSLANTAGDTYAVQAVTWIQGESDYISNTTQAAYLSSLNTLVSDIQTDLKAVTGQTKRIAVIGYQIATHINYAADDIPDIALAQLECAENNANFYIATPMYHFSYSDGGHLTGPGSQWLGAYLGLAYKRIVIDGEEWSPVRPISSVRQGNIAELRFHVPKGRLVFDTTTIANQTNKGFQLVNSGGSALTISNVEIVDYDRVRITAAASIPSGAKLRYAWQGDSYKGLGNLRDTQGNTIAFDPDGVNFPLHNWCVIFERSL